MKELNLNGIKLALGNVVLHEIYSNTFEGGRSAKSAHLSQERITTYPSKNMSTGFGAGLFDNPDGDEYRQVRNCLVAIPDEASEEEVKAQIEKFEEACLSRIISNNLEDVIGDRIKNAIEQGYTDLETQRAKFVVRDGDGNIYANFEDDGTEIKEEDRVVGKVILDDNKVVGMDITNTKAVLEYSTTVFNREWTADQDLREYKVVNTTVEEEKKEEITA